MEIMIDFAKIFEINIKSKVGKITNEDYSYLDNEYIKETIKKYLDYKNIKDMNIDYENKQSMLNFINIELLTFLHENNME
mgnify:CR=1 FL=1